jgi:malonate transporter
MPIAESLIAVFLCILVGWAVTARGFVRPEQWQGLNWLAYYVLYPCIVIDALTRARLQGETVIAILLALVLGLVTVAGLTLALWPLLRRAGMSGPAFTAVFQGAARWQTFVAFALAASILGPEGTAYVSLAVVAFIPLVNVMSVAVLLRWGTGGAQRQHFLVELAKNPFIVSCVVGIVLNLLGITGPRALFSAMNILGNAGLAAALILTGASLRLAEAHRIDLPVSVAVVIKLVVMPAVVYGFSTLLGITGTALTATMICASVPTAAAAVILAQQMGGDVPLMARIATVQTLVAIATMPFWIALGASSGS